MTYEEMCKRLRRRNIKRTLLGLPAEHEFEYNNAKYYWDNDRILLKEIILKDGMGEFEIPEFVTGIYATPHCSPFYNCRSLKLFNRSGIEDMRYLFYECRKLVELDLSGFDTSRVHNMRGMFRNCSHLVKLDLTGLDTSKVITMAEMFSGCVALMDPDLSSFDTSNVSDMHCMFDGCTGLTSLDLSCFSAARLRNAEFMFRNCCELSRLDLSGFDTAKSIYKTQFAAMFIGCDKLTELRVDETVTGIFNSYSGNKG